MEYVSPVLAAVEVVLDAFQIASDVRAQAKDAFKPGDLERKFGDIEIFLATFPDDTKVKTAAVELVAVTLRAIENTIGFFLKNDLKKATSTLFKGKNYQHELIESISDIEKKSSELVHHAQTSHISATKQTLNRILEASKLILEMDQTTSKKLGDMGEKLDSVAELGKKSGAEILNIVRMLLDDGEANRLHRAEVSQKLEKLEMLLDSKTQENERLLQEIHAITPRYLTPAPETHLLTFPNRPMQQLPFLLHHPGELAQVMQLHQSPMWQQQQQWSPSMFWTPFVPQQLEAYAPMSEAAAGFHGVSPWAATPYPSIASIRKLVNMTDIDISDLEAADEDRGLIPGRERAMAKAVVGTTQFRRWAVAPESRELLIHGDESPGRRGGGEFSALSLLCADVVRALRNKKSGRYVSLVFFCGRHVEDDDGPRGGRAMARSFIHQLLRQRPFGDDVSLDGLGLAGEAGSSSSSSVSLGILCGIFGRLVRLLPADVIVVSVIDGVSHYEKDRLEAGMLAVLETLLGLARDDNVAAAVKVLATSPGRTDTVQKTFRAGDDASFLSMARIRPGNQARAFGLDRSTSGSDMAESDLDRDSEESEDVEEGSSESDS
ncbi:hypothetical protein MAPG_10911 [Magnaporthiopsis poae ATCC 64411]|uniref:Uncharacterized protein n=1 Tax=Magnaporthiopsis poae (strain ATCC 64411 / 73-15) TaxID=644358 RepID=A0A0C4EDV0_MAGP6|nr:hypothetical protein MAPG_10911 [Magnaporthiopsis poae ATCC 64411]